MLKNKLIFAGKKLNKKERYKLFIEYFSKTQPNPKTELHYRNPFELVIAVILSAQCTDKRVNLVTPKLFEKFPTPEHLANASYAEVFEIIKSVSYPNNKSKHIVEMAKKIVQDYGSVVPKDIKELQKLPGVGRKSANVIASVIYSQPAMAVDTHVFRVSKRLGLVSENAKTPLAVEKELVKNIPKKYIPHAHHWLILHGRYICLAKKPLCEICQIKHFCKFIEKNQEKNTSNTDVNEI